MKSILGFQANTQVIGKTTAMVSIALAIFSVGSSGSAMTNAPTVTVLNRVEVGPAVFGASKLIKDKAGHGIYISIQKMAGSPQIQKLSAVDETGKVVAEDSIWASELPDRLQSIRDAGYNSRDELVVILGKGSNVSGDSALTSQNLTKKTSVPLITTGRFPQFGGRLTVKGHVVVVVTADLDARTNVSDPSIVRVIDEDTGKVVGQSIVDFGVQAELGLASDGKLKTLIYGNELFGIIDVASGKYTELLKPSQAPHVYPGTLELSTGKFVTISNEKTQKLYDRKDLFDGVLREIREFAISTQFLASKGASAPDYAIERTETSLHIVNIKTGVAEGPAIPKGMTGRKDAGVVGLIKTPQGLITLVVSSYLPNSYMRGAMLDYIEVKTGKLLRHAQSTQDELRATMLLGSTGHVLTLEKVPSFSYQPGPHFVLVDLTSGQQLASGTTDLMGTASLSTSGRVFALAPKGDQVCALDLVDGSADACIADAKVIGDIVYGYEPFSIDGAVVTLPLLQRVGPNSIATLGYATLRVD
jgi:hypothetical protein